MEGAAAVVEVAAAVAAGEIRTQLHGVEPIALDAMKRLLRPRFSLAMLLFVMAVVGAALKGIVLPKWEAAKQRQLISRLYLGGISVEGDHIYFGPTNRHNWKVSRDAFAELPQLKQVTSVVIEGDTNPSRQVTAECLSSLARMPQIRVLRLYNVPSDNDGLAFLASLSSLEELMLQGVVLTANDLKYLEDLKNLRSLYIYDAIMNGEMIESISRLRHLRHLFLVDCEMHAAPIGPLRQLTSLNYVCLSGTGVSTENIREWKMERPNLKIEIDEY